MPVKTAQRLEAERLCSLLPSSVPSRTIARRISDEYQIPLEQARSHVRAARGNKGDKSRHLATSPRENQPAGTKPKLPPTWAEDWLPFHLYGSRKIGCIADPHIPFHSKLAINGAVREIKRFNPDTIFLNGDGIDFYSISRFMKNPKFRKLKEEIGLAKQFFAWLRDQFPKCRIVFKLGNHDERWEHWLWNHAPEISDFPQMHLGAWLEADKLGIEIVEGKRPVMAGKLAILHGHELPRGISNPVNAARGAFMRTISTVLVAHQHQTSQHTQPNLWHEPITTWSQGCLCTLNPEYAPVNNWNWGAVKITVANDGEFDVENFRIGTKGQAYR